MLTCLSCFLSSRSWRQAYKTILFLDQLPPAHKINYQLLLTAFMPIELSETDIYKNS